VLHLQVSMSGPSGRRTPTHIPRARRIKCDETKPSCMRCVKTHRKCDGYPLPKLPRRPTPAQLALYSERSAQSVIPTIPAAPPADPDWDPAEQRAFSFYRHCSGLNLFGTAASPVWNSIIPALCHREPAIRHAVVVVSHLHETRYHGSPRLVTGVPALGPFAAAHYGRALRALRQWQPPEAQGTVSGAVPLLACALFVCVEFMAGNNAAARMHIDQGRQLLSSFEVGRVSTPAAGFLRDHLAPIFSKLALSAVVLGGTPTPLPMGLRITGEGGRVRMPEVFATAADAARAFFEVADDSLASGREARLWVRQPMKEEMDEHQRMVERAALVSEKKRLEGLFEAWLKAVVRSGFEGDEVIRVAMCYYHQARIFTGTSLSVAEGAFDDHLDDFSAIVGLCEGLIGGNDGETRFRFDMGVMPPLYITTIKCRHAGTRRSALSLLRRLAARGFKENSWDAQQMVNIAARVVQLEEETGEGEVRRPDWRGVAVPEAARIRNAVIGTGDGEGAWTTFYRQRAAGDDGGWMVTREYISASAGAEGFIGYSLGAGGTSSAYVPFHVYSTEGDLGVCW
jgi:Zn(2)-Cys(6) binuclear cluster domain-containing protein